MSKIILCFAIPAYIYIIFLAVLYMVLKSDIVNGSIGGAMLAFPLAIILGTVAYFVSVFALFMLFGPNFGQVMIFAPILIFGSTVSSFVNLEIMQKISSFNSILPYVVVVILIGILNVATLATVVFLKKTHFFKYFAYFLPTIIYLIMIISIPTYRNYNYLNLNKSLFDKYSSNIKNVYFFSDNSRRYKRLYFNQKNFSLEVIINDGHSFIQTDIRNIAIDDEGKLGDCVFDKTTCKYIGVYNNFELWSKTTKLKYSDSFSYGFHAINPSHQKTIYFSGYSDENSVTDILNSLSLYNIDKLIDENPGFRKSINQQFRINL